MSHRVKIMDFTNIRLNSYKSQNDAFEQLCCQLFKIHGEMNNWEHAEFVRKNGAGGDAGIECYWKFDSNEEYGLQAKFSDDLNNLWDDLNKSVKVALIKHPNIVKYYICTPFDRSERRIPRRKSDMDKWNDYVKKWKKLKDIEFIWWGRTELETILSIDNPYSSGLKKYWFDNNVFNRKWFEDYLEKIKIKSGPRYNSELNVDVDAYHLLEDVLRSKNSLKEIKNSLFNLKEEYGHIFYNFNREEVNEFYGLDKLFDELFRVFETYIYDNTINVNDYKVITEKFKSKYSELKTHAREFLKDKEKEDNVYYYFYKMDDIWEKLSLYVDLCQHQNYLLRGNAGYGKTHLLCHLYNQSVKNGDYIFLLCMAHTFSSSGNLVAEILNDLEGFDNINQLLAALNSYAISHQQIACLAIDGINEWNIKKENICIQVDLLAYEISKYSNVKLIVSCRNEYVEEITKNLQMSYQEIEHIGFVNNSVEALMMFCRYYRIEIPSTPIVCAELYNPLILKTLCDVYKGVGKFPKEMKGICSFFDTYLSYLNKKISDALDMDDSDKRVISAIDIIAQQMYQNNTMYVEKAEIKTLVNHLNVSQSWTESIIYQLIKEGFLIEVFDKLYISYERYRDYLISKILLIEADKIKLNEKNNFFISSLDKLQEQGCFQGIIRFLSVALPEKYNIEIFDLYKGKKISPWKYDEINHSFFYSLSIRNPHAISDNTMNWIDYLIKKDFKNIEDSYWIGVINCAILKNHPLNIDFLHKKLAQKSMKDIDASWTQFISLNFEGYTSYRDINEYFDLKNILQPYLFIDSNALNDDMIYKISKLFIWFTVSTNRALRNYATVAAVNLLVKKEKIMLNLYEDFKHVADIYLQEKLYQIIYSVCLFSDDKEVINLISDKVFETVFNSGVVFPNILVRDSASNLIEYSKIVGNDISKYRKKHLPPYNYPLIENYPTKEDVENNFSSWRNSYSDEQYSKGYIYSSSVCGDFNHYSINFISNWYDCPLTEQLNILLEKRGVSPRSIDFLDGKFVIKEDLSKGYTEVEVVKTEMFSKSKAGYWICKRAYDLGWQYEKHGQYDRDVARLRSDRRRPNIERIGKKYQWIAYREFLCNLMDNYWYKGYSNKHSEFNLEKMREFRNFDATFLVDYKHDENYTSFNTKPHISNFFLDKAFEEVNIEQQEVWLNTVQEDICYGKKLIGYEKNGVSYVKLDDYINKIEADIHNRYSDCRRDFGISETAYLVKKSSLEDFVRFLNDKLNGSSNGFNIFFKETELADLYLMEYPIFYMGCSGDSNEIFSYDKDLEKYNIQGFPCVISYRGNIFNKEEKNFVLPHPKLISLLNLILSKDRRYIWRRDKNEIIFNEMIYDKESNILAANKKYLLDLVRQTDFELVFVINTEKRLYGKGLGDNSRYPWKYYTTVYKYNENLDLESIFQKSYDYPDD